MQLMVPIDLDALIEAFVLSSAQHEHASDMILKIDLAIGDAGFTEALIKRLAKSLRGDSDELDWAAFTAEIGAMKP